MQELLAANVNTPRGTKVVVIQDRGHPPCVTHTRSEPWSLGDGRLVVSLKGKSGGYALERVFLLPE